MAFQQNNVLQYMFLATNLAYCTKTPIFFFMDSRIVLLG